MVLLVLSSATFSVFPGQTRNSAPRADADEAPRPSQKVYRGAGARVCKLADTYLARCESTAPILVAAPSGGIPWANGEWLNLLLRRSLYFLRKRSSRTTSPPPAGLSGCASEVVVAGSGLAGTGTATFTCVIALCSAGERAASESLSLAAAVPWPACSDACASASAISSNCKPNCTEGSKKAFTAANGTVNRSGTPPKDTPTSKPLSVTTKSQNWCCRTTVISVGYCASMRGDRRTPSARVSKEI